MGGAHLLVGRLHPKLTLRQRLACHLDAAVAAVSLGRLEHRQVDLGAKDLAHAAHVVTAAERIHVAVQIATAKLQAAARVNETVAEGAAPTALAGLDTLLLSLLERHVGSLNAPHSGRERLWAQQVVELGTEGLGRGDAVLAAESE